MDLIALILAVVALLVFAYDALKRPATNVALLPLGLAFLTASWICQATTLSNHMVNF